MCLSLVGSEMCIRDRYFSRKNVSSELSTNENIFNKKDDLALKINPIIVNQNRKLVPGVSVNLFF